MARSSVPIGTRTAPVASMRTFVPVLFVSTLCLAGCWNGGERAPGAPLTDVTKTSTETYARRVNYDVIDAHRDGSRLTLDINVRDLGHAEDIARQAAAEKKGDASDVQVNVYGPMGHPPERPARSFRM
jgi:hypothetical protein